MSYGNMQGLWDYLGDVIDGNKSIYVTGGVGQSYTGGKYKYDCHGYIKSYPWTKGKAYGALTYKGNGLTTDDTINTVYSKASKKGAISSIPSTGIYCVYVSTAHIGIYNASTGTVRECCAGNTMKCVERKLSYYNGTTASWNKWSDLYWCPSVETFKTEGHLDVATYEDGKLTVSGWVYDNGGSNTVKIIVKSGSTTKSTFSITANKTRADVKEAKGYSISNVGFSTSKTLSLSAGTYTITATCGSYTLLDAKTITVTPTYKYSGFLDGVDSTTISGWCYNGVDDDSCKVTIKIYNGSSLKKTLTIVASKYRSDLKSAKIGNGKHGYSLSYKIETLGTGTYTIKAYAPDGSQLTNTKTYIVSDFSTDVGTKFTLKGTKVYNSVTTKVNDGTRSGTYYIYKNNTITNNRIRMTNSAGKAVSFFCDINDLKKL